MVFFTKKQNNPIYDRLVEYSMPFVKNVTVLTEEMSKELQTSFPKQYDILNLIPNGIDTSKFYYSFDARKQIQIELNLNEDDIIFITVASIQERKGQLSFIKYIQNLD